MHWEELQRRMTMVLITKHNMAAGLLRIGPIEAKAPSHARGQNGKSQLQTPTRRQRETKQEAFQPRRENSTCDLIKSTCMQSKFLCMRQIYAIPANISASMHFLSPWYVRSSHTIYASKPSEWKKKKHAYGVRFLCLTMWQHLSRKFICFLKCLPEYLIIVLVSWSLN